MLQKYTSFLRNKINVAFSPRDGIPDNETSTILKPVTVILIVFDIGGLTFAVVCLGFNLVYRNKRQVHISCYYIITIENVSIIIIAL